MTTANTKGDIVITAKDTTIAYVLWFFLGGLGVHQWYLGKKGRAVGYLLTGGWLTIGLWIDLFTLPAQVRAVNAQRAILGA